MKIKLYSMRPSLLVLFSWIASFLSLSPRVDAQDKQDFARWEKDIAAFERHDKKKAPPKNPIVFVGSSSIRFWDLEKSFPRLTALNRGFGGSHLADVVHFAPRILLKYDPRLIVLYAGDNDLAAGKTPERVRDDLRAFAKLVHDKSPKVRIIFISIKPSLLRWSLIDRIRKANALVEAECKKDERLVYLDIVTPMLGADGKPRRELFRPDGLHLNAKGYELWAERLKPYLEAAKSEAAPGKKEQR
jgi:lysophospholipase L1-like esterase